MNLVHLREVINSKAFHFTGCYNYEIEPLQCSYEDGSDDEYE